MQPTGGGTKSIPCRCAPDRKPAVNTPPKFENLIAPILANLGNAAMLTEIAVFAAIAVATWFGLRQLRRRTAEVESIHGHLSRSDWNRLILPAALLPSILIARAVMGKWQDVHLLNLAVPLTLSFFAIQACFYILRKILKPSRTLHLVERTVSWLVWGVFALYLTGYLDEVAAALDAVGFDVGKQHISLYTALVALLSLTATLMLALWLAHLVESRVIGAMPLTPNLRLAFTKLARGLFIVVAVLIALPLVGIDITVLSVFGGALGVGLGLGLQKIAANYVSGFTLLLEQSIRIGDMVQVDRHYGEVKEIATRYTVLRSLDGSESVIPNETMITSPVINKSLTDKDNQILLPVQVAYGSDLERVRDLLLEIAAGNDRVQDAPSPRVRLQSFGDNGINLELVVWIQDPEEGEANLRSDLNWAVWTAFRREGIEIPFPQRVIHMAGKATPAP
jgi:small-conductance mechanosensitive channel